MSVTEYDVALPPAVRRQVELADQAAREAGVRNVPEAREPGPEYLSDKLPTVVNGDSPPVEPTPESAPEHQQPELPLGDEPRTAPAPSEVDWQQRYNTLQGKYNTDRRELSETQAQVRALERVIADIQRNQQVQQAPPPRAAPPPPMWEIPAEDREAYGEELITKAQYWAEAKLAPKIAALEARIAEYGGRTDQIQAHAAALTVEGQLDRAVPNWRAIDNDPAWWAWLNQPDPFSGHTRRQLITDANARGEGPRTIAFFQAFLREQTAVDPNPGTQPVHTNAGNGAAHPADRLPLEALAAPGRGATAPAAPSAQPRRTWTNAQINALYRDKTIGRWDGRDDDFARLEQEINLAAREGRITQ